MITFAETRGISAVGSAQHWQCWGQEFESPMLHQQKPLSHKGLRVFLVLRPLRAACPSGGAAPQKPARDVWIPRVHSLKPGTPGRVPGLFDRPLNHRGSARWRTALIFAYACGPRWSLRCRQPTGWTLPLHHRPPFLCALFAQKSDIVHSSFKGVFKSVIAW